MPTASQPGSKWRILGASTLLVFLLLLFAGMVTDWLIMPLYTRHGSERPVPKLEGMTIGEARGTAEQGGFRVEVEPAKIGGNVPEGTVLEQRPLPGAFAKPGRTIHIVPSRSGSINAIPDLTGLDQRDAEIECRNLGLLISPSGISYDFSAIVPKGGIVKQRPEPGTPVRGVEAVQLVVSLGPRPQTIVVPTLVDLSLHEARQALLESGLRLGKVTRKNTNVFTAGTVIAQSIVSGTEVEQMTEVELIVAVPQSGPDNTSENTANPDAN